MASSKEKRLPNARELEVADRVMSTLLGMTHGDNAGAVLAIDGGYKLDEIDLIFGMLLDLTVSFGTEACGREGFIAWVSNYRSQIAELERQRRGEQ